MSEKYTSALTLTSPAKTRTIRWSQICLGGCWTQS
ncbi:MAG: hypothetical protein QOF41_1055 [Methylobacteriaceae bacterium]|nr:hypothetical protein [Methylobacteriaceae bacterium]